MKNKKSQSFRLITCLIFAFILIYVRAVLVENVAMNPEITGNETKIEVEKTTYSNFINELNQENIEKVMIKGNEIVAISKEKEGVIYKYVINKIDDSDLVNRLIEKNVEFDEVNNSSATLLGLAISIVPYALFIYFIMKTMNGKNGIMGVGKSNAKVYDVEKSTGIMFQDVAGEDEAKESLAEIVDFLHNPEKYKKIGSPILLPCLRYSAGLEYVLCGLLFHRFRMKPWLPDYEPLFEQRRKPLYR